MTKQLCSLSGFFGGGGNEGENRRGGFQIEKWGPFSFVDWMETLYGRVDSIRLDFKRDVKKKKKSHVVEFLLNHVSYSMPSN
jgi:hypothetical protein